ncbi:MAG: glycine betaine ABC transporter substrate-binding protein [Desulfitobacteriaceae bacterium]
MKLFKKKLTLISVVSALVLALALGGVAGCGSTQSGDTGATKKGPTIKISSKTFTEAQLLGTMSLQYLQSKGYPVENKMGLGELAVIRPALESKQIDMYWEYTGTGILALMKADPIFEEKAAYKAIKDWDAKNGIAWLDYAPLNDTYAIVTPKEVADKYNLKTTSDYVNLLKSGTHLKFVSFVEWDERADGLPAFEKTYDFKMPKGDIVDVAMGLNYDTLKNKKGDLALAFTTEPRILTDNLVALKDDKQAFPVYNAAPVVRQEILDAYPDLAKDLKALSSVIDTTTITDLNKQVDVDKKSIEEVSTAFLKSKGLIK